MSKITVTNRCYSGNACISGGASAIAMTPTPIPGSHSAAKLKDGIAKLHQEQQSSAWKMHC
jgi:hypothetical protein